VIRIFYLHCECTISLILGKVVNIWWLGYHRASDVVGEYITVAMLPEVDNHLIHETAIECVVGDDRVAEFSQDESDLWSVFSLAAIVASRRTRVGNEGEPTAFLQADLA